MYHGVVDELLYTVVLVFVLLSYNILPQFQSLVEPVRDAVQDYLSIVYIINRKL